MNSKSAQRHRCSRYLLLGFSLGTWFDGQEDTPPLVVCTTGYKSARLASVILASEGSLLSARSGQWRLCIEIEPNNLVGARRVLSGFEGLFTHLYHGRIDDLSIEPLPASAIRGRRIQGANLALAAVSKARRAGEVFMERSIASRIRSFYQVPSIITAYLLYQLPTVLQCESLFAACGFFQSACTDYTFTGNSISNVRRRRKLSAEYEREKLKLENVVLSSFRVVEAIVGEPGREERFKKSLASWGLDFDELVGFPGTKRKSLGKAIYALQKLRDTTSAHGIRRRPSPITWYEAMEAQHLAESVLHQALWQECCRRGRPEGTDVELRYLLNQMYPLCAFTGWLGQTFSELDGMTPLEASRHPNGPAKVQGLSERLSGMTIDSPQLWPTINPLVTQRARGY
jgi:hypothetical protein